MILDTPLVDWLTLTTFDTGLFQSSRYSWQSSRARYHRLIASKRKSNSSLMKVKKAKVLQYDGQDIDGVFWGAAMQAGRDHFMVRSSGETSHYLAMEHGALLSMNCTRIDLQMTVDLPVGYSALGLREELVAAKWNNGRRPKVTCILGDNGLDTVYVGSRTSDRYLRCYVKETDEGRVLRYEIETKGDLALSIWHRMGSLNVGTVAAQALADSYARIPEDGRNGWLSCFAGLKEYGDRSFVGSRVVTEASRTMQWLQESVLPAVARLASDHEQRVKVAGWLRDCQDVMDSFENKGEGS